jgi:hypothetical protein
VDNWARIASQLVDYSRPFDILLPKPLYIFGVIDEPSAVVT